MFLLTALLVVSSETLRTGLQDGFARLAMYPPFFGLFLLLVLGMMFGWSFAASKSQYKVKIDCENMIQEDRSGKQEKNQNQRPDHVGILAMEVYFPANYIDQADLEQYDGVSAGKYTKGLGQEKMSFVGDREDINSIALTVVKNLLEKYDIDPAQIGRLEIGTETMVDLCKSTKTVLMDLFKESGNSNIEGITTVNACYGGTAALFNSVAWVESRAWDGRYALVVCGDIAVYAKGPARPTCGCGAVAMLIGPNAPLVMESELRTTYAENMWDFYKPDPHSEYPTVDGKFSQSCYLRTLDDCYRRFCVNNEQAGISRNGKFFDLAANDYILFHSPYNKLAQKGFSRLLFNDFLRNPSLPQYAALKKWHGVSLEATYFDRELDLVTRDLSSDMYKKLVVPSATASQLIGNCYTASVYINLACLVDKTRAQLHGKRIMMFSYGSGGIGSIFSLRCRNPAAAAEPSAQRNVQVFTVDRLANCVNLGARLEKRVKRTPEDFSNHLLLREKSHGLKSYVPQQPVSSLFPGTYYLVEVDEKHRRKYARKSHNEVLEMTPVPVTFRLPRRVNESKVKIMVTGVSAGIPGSDRAFNDDNIDALLNGRNMIEMLHEDVKQEMLDRKIVQIKKLPNKGTERIPVSSMNQCIKIAAVLRPVDLVSQYGIPKSLAECMDSASQCAVAAGLEALKNAGLVSGTIENGWGHWRLPEALCDSTGVIFATSFPALDSAVSEVSRYHKEGSEYEFDRKLLFRLLVLANSQLAQIVGAKGPNTQVNAACAGTTMAVSLAQDWLLAGKCKRVVVIAGDTASNDRLMPWVGSGFRALGAATLASSVQEGALPFDKRRNGMLMGSGAVGLVLEAETPGVSPSQALSSSSPRVELLASQISNSAYHGASLDKSHIAQELNRFLQTVETSCGLSRQEIAEHGVYFSHETFTQASPTTSCAYSEIHALRNAFGDELMEKLLIANTKGFTGHPMGVSFEEIAAVEGLKRGLVPPVANFEQYDEHLGLPLRLSTGGNYPIKYALRFAAGFGSQIAFTLYGKN